MRITGGELGGREIRVPKTGVRPTQDRVRAALFSILATRVAGSRFLDLCAGSGSVGLEAWSRGAAFVAWVEVDRRALDVLRDNVRTLCGEAPGVFGMDAVRFLKKNLVAEGFHIIFCDPPYDKEGRGSQLEPVLEALRGSPLLLDGGLVILEQDAAEPVVAHEGWRVVDDRVYGQTRLRFVVREAPATRGD